MVDGKSTVFFSYAREDADFALKLAKDLRVAGAQLWIDQLDIVGGQRWDQAVEEALKQSPGVLVVLSPNSVASNNVLDEVSFALGEGKQVVPVLHQACEIPYRLSRIHHIDFTVDYSEGLERLVQALGIRDSADIGAAPNAVESAPREDTNHSQKATQVTPKRSRSELFWLIGVVLLGLWPILTGPGDDPYLVNPMIIAGCLVLMAFWKPLAPLVAVAFCIVPYVLNLIGMLLFLRGRYLSEYYFTSEEFIIGLVAFAASLIIVPIICSRRQTASS